MSASVIANKVLRNVTKPKGSNVGRYAYLPENKVQQIDLISMPPDQGYNHILTLADQSRVFSAIPLKTKSARETLDALQRLYRYNRLGLKKPQNLQFDGGGEFDNDIFKKWAKDNNITLKKGITGRSKQQALVEKRNGQLSYLIGARDEAERQITGDVKMRSTWVKYLPRFVREINEESKPYREKLKAKQESINKKVEDGEAPKISGKNPKILTIGTKVRIALNKPETIGGVKKSGKFRVGDVKWSNTIYTVYDIDIVNRGSDEDASVKYLLKDSGGEPYKESSFSRNELQIANDKHEDFGDLSKIAPNKKVRTELLYKILDIVDKVEGKGKNKRIEKVVVYLIRGSKEPRQLFINKFKERNASYAEALTKFQKENSL